MNSGWRKERLASVAVKITDGSHNPPKGVAVSEYLMLSSKNVFDDNFHYEEPRYLTAEQFHQENKRTGIVPGDVLLTIVGTIGRSAVVRIDAPRITLQRSVAVIRPMNQIIEPRFLMYSFIARNAELNDQARGVAQKGIYLETLRELEVIFPTLPEQQRIVAVLDEAFDGIATAKANAEKNLQNAREVFESHLQSVFALRGTEWVDWKKPLEELCELVVDCEHKTAPMQDEGIPSIRTPNIGKGNLLLEGVYRVSENTYREWTRRAEPVAGDLILAREAPAGNVAVIPENMRVCLGQRTVLIRPRRNIFDSKFLAQLLLSPAMQQRLLAHSRGATVQHVNMKDIRALQVGPIPVLSEQKEIVAKLTELSAETQRLESAYQQKLTALGELKKSLLHQAFSGAL